MATLRRGSVMDRNAIQRTHHTHHTLTGKLVVRNKCIILGNATVGKSAIVQQFHAQQAKFPKNYSMTIYCDVYVKMVIAAVSRNLIFNLIFKTFHASKKVNMIADPNAFVELFLVDLGGMDIFQEYAPKYTEGAGSFVIVYDVTSQDSFNSIHKWLELARKATAGNSHPVGMLVANKIDLEDRRVISWEQGEELAKNNGLQYFECSAANRSNIDTPFMDVCTTVFDQYEDVVSKFELF